MISRRSFIQAGLLGAVALAAAGSLYRFSHRTPPQRFRFDGAATAALAAIVPAMLQDALPTTARTEALEAAVARVQGAIDGLPLRTQKEIADLFALLTLGPARRLLTGVPHDWPQAAPEDVAAFLQSWRHHRFALLQSAYLALHDLIIGAWYTDASTWASIGYPGPHVRFR